jgi:hypothetical protein
VKPDQVQPWPWHQRGQPLHELQRAHHQVRGAVAPRRLELELHMQLVVAAVAAAQAQEAVGQDAAFEQGVELALQGAPGQRPGSSPGTNSPPDCLCPGSALMNRGNSAPMLAAVWAMKWAACCCTGC